MPELPHESVRAVAEQLRSFFHDRPDVADTVDGITKWWLARQRYEEARETVQEALEFLVSSGELRKVESQGGTVVYTPKSKNGVE